MAKGLKHGAGGGAPLNFKVVGGTSAPASPKENTIWINTHVGITSWHFAADEPNVYNIQPLAPNDPHFLVSPKKLSDGDIVNFTIPSDVGAIFEAIRIYDPVTDKQYCVRSQVGTALTGWPAGAKVGVRISNVRHQVGDWVGHGTAFLMTWDSYYHEEGTVWISTGTASTASFNALKKNGLQVYPQAAKQYVSGAWTAKRAQTYLSGAWKAPEYIIVPNTSATWTATSGNIGSASASKTADQTTISITSKSTAGGTAGSTSIYTEFDATAVGVLYIKGSYAMENRTGSAQSYGIALINSSGSTISNIVNRSVENNVNTGTVSFEKTIDISSVTGKCKLRVLCTTWTTVTLTFDTTINSCKVY